MENIVKQNTYFKNREKPFCRDLILTNSLCTFQNASAFKNHKLYHTESINDSIATHFKGNLLILDVKALRAYQFLNLFTKILNKHVPAK